MKYSNLSGERHIGFNPLLEHTVPLQVVRWTGKRAAVSFDGTSKDIVIPAGSILVEMSATENCYINFGTGSAPTATSTIADDGSRLFLAGVQVIPVPIDSATDAPYTHIGVLQESITGILQVEELT